MARLTRHELKEDEFVDAVDSIEDWGRKHAKELIIGVVAALAVAGAGVWYRTYQTHQMEAANAALADALKTYKAQVSASPVNLFASGTQPTPTAGTFTSDQEKYKAAMKQFSDVQAKYSGQPAAEFARFHVGLCQAALGDDAGAQKTLEAASHAGNKEVSSLSSLALAGELAKVGKTPDALKIYQNLADHPTPTVPRTTALLAEADLYRNSQPAQARKIYESIAKDVGTDSYVSSMVQEQLASLPK